MAPRSKILLKRLLLLVLLAFTAGVVYKNVNFKDLLLQRVRSTTDPEKSEVIQQLTGRVVHSPGTPKPWLEPSFEFISETGIQQTYQVARGWELQPGLLTLIQNIEIRTLILMEFLLILGLLFTVIRWHLLLKAGEIPTTFYQTFRFSSIGVFCNAVMPGSTGGDLIKGVLIVRGTPIHRERAVITILLDRMLGMAGLLTLACILVSFRYEEFKAVALFLYLIFFGLVFATLILFNKTLRRWIRLEWILSKLPAKVGGLLKKIDEAILFFKKSSFTFGIGLFLSMLNHLVALFGCYLIGHSLGDRLSFDSYMILLGLGNVFIAIPISPFPGGLGLREVTWGLLFEQNGSSYNMGVVLATSFFLLSTLLYSAGGLFLLTPEGKKIKVLALNEENKTNTE